MYKYTEIKISQSWLWRWLCRKCILLAFYDNHVLIKRDINAEHSGIKLYGKKTKAWKRTRLCLPKQRMNLLLLLTIYFINNFDFLKHGSCKYDPKKVVLNISRWNYVSCDGFPGCTSPYMDEEAMARAVFKAPIIAHIYASWFVDDMGINISIYGPINLKKNISKFSLGFDSFGSGVFSDECCSNKTSYDVNHGFAIIFLTHGLSLTFPFRIKSIFTVYKIFINNKNKIIIKIKINSKPTHTKIFTYFIIQLFI